MSTTRTLAIALGALLLDAAALASSSGAISGTIQASQDRLKKNTLIYIERVPGEFPPPKTRPTVDQKNQVFVPFVLPIVVGTTVDFLNSDATGHSIFSPDGEKFDFGVFQQHEVRDFTFKQEGVYSLLCKLHPSMISYVVVVQNPFFAVSDERGVFRIDGIPPGSYRLKVWHERRKAQPIDVQVRAGQVAAVQFELKK